MSRVSAETKIQVLHDRASMLAKARAFFAERQVMEVDCPILSSNASIDAHIDLISAKYNQSETRFLHSSPEFGMKRLLAQQSGDIYQLSHVFRDGECGVKHNPEFMMAEWYRIGVSFEFLISETFDFIRLLLGPLPTMTITYREAFFRFSGLDCMKASFSELLQYLRDHHIPIYAEIENEDKDALLNLILASVIEPQLGNQVLCALTHYPASQAALAKTISDGTALVAERFEVYYRGVELANGYHELADASEQRRRFIESNEHRRLLGKPSLPIDEHFLSALQSGMPDCCGVAVGFDRLMMLRHQSSHIQDVIPFGWNEA